MKDRHELLIGCGTARVKRMTSQPQFLAWADLTTLDIYEACKPDLLCDLERVFWCPEDYTDQGERCIDWAEGFIKDDYFDEVHAYEVLEHLGHQGDAVAFFELFAEIYRVLKPGGYLFATVPSKYSGWAWGDPGHRRIITREALVFLDREQIHRNRVNKTPMTDYDHLWGGDFKIFAAEDDNVFLTFALQAMKPPRPPVA
jgi:SAM-dependent methyltransferase